MNDQTKSSRVLVSVALVLVGVLALVAVILIQRDRLKTEVASNGQDTAPVHLGLTDAGFGTSASAKQPKPVAEIAAGLVTDALSFTPENFDARVKAAQLTMTGTMQKQYNALLKDQQTRALVVEGGFTVTMSVQHDSQLKPKPAYLGVVSLTPDRGEFVMKLVRTSTTKGSAQAQAVEFVIDATVVKVGTTWMLNSLQTI